MKCSPLISAPLLAFVSAAVLALLIGPLADSNERSENAPTLSKRKRSRTPKFDSGTPTNTLAALERNILHHPAPPEETYDAKSMEAGLALDMDRQSMGIPGGGMSSIEYASDWAKDAPEEMFAWLIEQNNSFYSRGVFMTYLLFRTWAEKDMSRALAAVREIPDPMMRAQALISSLGILSMSDAARAGDLIAQNLALFPDDISPLVFGGAEVEIAMCDVLLALPTGNVKTQLLASLFNEMVSTSYSEGGVVKARALWGNAEDSIRREWVAADFGNKSYVSSDVESWASFEGLEELIREQAEMTGDLEYAHQFIANWGPAWAARDLTAAFEWSQNYLKGKSRVEGGAELFRHAAAQDPSAALSVWESLPEGKLKSQARVAFDKGLEERR